MRMIKCTIFQVSIAVVKQSAPGVRPLSLRSTTTVLLLIPCIPCVLGLSLKRISPVHAKIYFGSDSLRRGYKQIIITSKIQSETFRYYSEP